MYYSCLVNLMKKLILLTFCLICFPMAVLAEDKTQADDNAIDRMEMDDTAIVGARELPKVLYVVPWKDTEITLSTASTETPARVRADVLDRDVYQREVAYHGLLNSGGVAPK